MIREWTAALRSMSQTGSDDPRLHLRLAGNWLLQAQAAGHGGFSHSYSLWEGWRPPYPETTGYLIPTLFELADFLGDPVYKESALKAGAWLLTQQGGDGAFKGLSGKSFVFDTGQIVRGLLACHQRTGQEAYLAAARRAGDWLTAVQETDGSWVRHAYLDLPHSYYLKVASALQGLAAASGRAAYAETAGRNLSWVLSQQLPNGFFQRAAFTQKEEPFIHTVVYILEALLEFQCSEPPSQDLLQPIQRLSSALLAAEQRDGGLLYARYDAEWRPALRQRCLVGHAQWAAAGVALAGLFNDRAYFESAGRNIEFLKAKQVRGQGGHVTGALPASLPIWGQYVPYSFVNWGVKYFIDAVLALERDLLWKTT